MPITAHHSLTMTTPDNPAYENRPSHWNEAHLMTANIVGSEVSGAFSNAGNVTFGLETNGFITASANAAGAGDGFNRISAGTQLAGTNNTIVFSNSNGITFGMSNSSVVTASHNGLTTAAASDHSHGNPTLNLTNISGTTASNSAGLTLSLSAAAAVTTNGLLSAVNVSAGTTSNNLSALTFADSNGITFGLNASTVTASHNGLTTAAASNHSHGNPTLALTNLSGTTASNSAGLTLSLSANAPGAATLTVSAVGNTTVNSTGTWANAVSARAYGVLSIGTSNGSLLFSTPDPVDFTYFSAGASTGGNTAGDTGVFSQRLVLAGGANITLSGSSNGGSATLSIIGGAGGGGGAAISAGTQSVSTGTVVWSNSNNITFGMSGSSRVTASAALNLYALGNTTQNSSTVLGIEAISFNGLGAQTVGYSNGSVQLSVPATSSLVAGANITVSTDGSTISIIGGAGGAGFSAGVSNNGNTAGDTGMTATRLVLVGSNNLTLSQATGANGATVTFLGADTHAVQTGISGLIASDATYTSGSVYFSNQNGVTVGSSVDGASQYVRLSVNTSYAASNHSHGDPQLNLTNLSGTTASNSAGFTLSLSAADPGGGGNFSAGMSNLGNTVGDSGVTGSRVVFVGSHGVTLSQGTDANGATITFSSPEQTGISGIQVSNTTYTSGTVTWQNANGISFGSSGANGISASYTVPNTAGLLSALAFTGSNGNFTATAVLFSNANGISFGTSAGSAIFASHNGLTSQSNQAASADNGSFAFQTVQFTNANGVSFVTSAGSAIAASVETSYAASNHSHGNPTLALTNLTGTTASASNGFTLSLSAAAPGAAAEANAINLLGANTAGNTTATGSTIGWSGINLTLSGTNASQVVVSAPATSSLSATGVLSISTNGSTISIGVPAGTATMWQPFNEAPNVVGQQGNAILHFVPLPTPAPAALGEVHIDRLCLPLVLSNSSNSTGSVTISHSFGLYTKNVSTLSLVMSTSYTTAATFSGTVNNSTFAGVRLHTVPWTTTIGDGRYYVAQWSRTTTGGGNATFNQVLASAMNSNYSGLFGANSNRSLQWPVGLGAYSVSFSTAMPGSVAFSHIDGTGSIVARPPSFFMINGTV